MSNFFKRFAQDESGAVTVDYVVLTAAIVGLSHRGEQARSIPDQWARSAKDMRDTG